MIRTEELLKHITNEIVVNIMKDNGSELYDTTIDGKTKQKCLWFQTICHGGDSHKLCYFTESKDFYCYTNCGRMKFFECIKRIRNAKEDEFYSKVILYVAEKANIRLSNKMERGINPDPTKAFRKEMLEFNRNISVKYNWEKQYNNDIVKFYDENILRYFDSNTFYEGWINEGISIESMRKFGISWYEYRNCIIIPHRNKDGKLVGIRRRTLNPDEADSRKYMPLYMGKFSYEHPLASNLYGLYENQEAIKRREKAIIVEGEKSVLKSDTYFGKDSICVATCGFNISEWQIKALERAGAKTVYLGFDKDFDINKVSEYKKQKDIYNEYLRYIEKLNAVANRLNIAFDTYVLLDSEELLNLKDSPFDEGKDVFNRLMKTCLKVKDGKIRYVKRSKKAKLGNEIQF